MVEDYSSENQAQSGASGSRRRPTGVKPLSCGVAMLQHSAFVFALLLLSPFQTSAQAAPSLLDDERPRLRRAMDDSEARLSTIRLSVSIATLNAAWFGGAGGVWFAAAASDVAPLPRGGAFAIGATFTATSIANFAWLANASPELRQRRHGSSRPSNVRLARLGTGLSTVDTLARAGHMSWGIALLVGAGDEFLSDIPRIFGTTLITINAIMLPFHVWSIAFNAIELRGARRPSHRERTRRIRPVAGGFAF